MVMLWGGAAETNWPVVLASLSAGSRHGYLGDDGRAELLSPARRGGTLAGAGATSVAPAALSHLGRQQTGSAAGQLTAAGANQRHLGDLGASQRR